MSLTTILLIILILILLGALPAWPHSQNWGYPPAIIIVLIIILVLFLR